ncbi:RdRP-domain-containing protein, partial [Backusella circina FSU 941]
MRSFTAFNVNPLTNSETLFEYFERYGKIEKLMLLHDDDGEFNGSAGMVFVEPLKDSKILTDRHTIDQYNVRMETNRSNYIEDPGFIGGRANDSSKLYARRISFGTMLNSKTFIEEWITRENVVCYLNYTHRQYNILFNHLDESYKLEYKFKDVDMKVERVGEEIIFTIPLRDPPRYFRRDRMGVQFKPSTVMRGKKYERVTKIPLTQEDAERMKREKEDEDERKKKGDRRPIMPIPTPGILNLSQWIVLRLVFLPPPRFRHAFEEDMEKAADFNLVPRLWASQKPTIKVVQAADLPKPKDHIFRATLGLQYEVLYMLESCISHHYISEYNLTDEFYDILKRADTSILIGILEIIASNKQRIWDPFDEFKSIWTQMEMKVCQKKNPPSHCAYLRKIIVSPTSMYFQPRSLEATNRVVRQYREFSDRFLRVQFVDEGLNRVSASYDQTTQEAIYERIFDVLKCGIQIGATRYEFLAFSSSQLREHGCWFFAPTNELNADAIRSWMGRFSHEKVIAKHAVRMGQCFSSTRPICHLAKDEVEHIPDVERNGYTFSDGVGKISPELAKEVAIHMELKVVPSALQFRLGGAKGVFVMDQALTGRKVQLRPSQIKFESEHLTLEVIRTSTYIHGYLNRQVITILLSLGVKDQVFLDLMDAMLLEINAIMKKPEEAMRVLMSNLDEAGTAMWLASIVEAGFLEKEDPFIVNLLNLFRVNVLKDLKKKAKIMVPQGAYLLGVMDELGVLEEGEVFVQICDTSLGGNRRKIIEGECVVFRNPCFHPGDVRVVTAVNYPELHYLEDVVVFSSKGERDIPSMCSGGDLDGDDYTVYWDPNLIPETKNYEPMDYTAAKPRVVGDVTIKHIIRFFVNYVNNDNLGKIANSHLAWADQCAQGARDPKCITLANLHSEAVDFPKSGEPARMTSDLIVQTYPDFMQKKDREMYQSQKVLGRIYRAIDKADYKNYKNTLMDETIYDTRMYVPGMEIYIKDARRQRFEYNRGLSAIMNHSGVQTEAEIISGYVIKWLKNGKGKSSYEQHDYTMKSVK